MTSYTWLYWSLSAVGGVAIGGFIFTRTEWYKIRKYAIDMKRVTDKHSKSLQAKTEAVQMLGQNPNPVLAKKPLKELIEEYKELLGELEKIKTSPKTSEIHEETLAMNREMMGLYQMAMVGGFRQKAMVDKQRKLQQMERSLTEKTEKLYGSMMKKAKKK